MAAPIRIFSLNLGTQTVGFADFRKSQDGGLILHAYRLTELMADPAADSTRLAQMKIAIEEIRKELQIKGGKVDYSVSGQSVFTRFVKLPNVEQDRIDQIIGFEAQQNVPFPIEEVVWDYQLVGSGEETKVEVVLVAIKADLLDDINASVEDAGFATAVVDVAPMALYNAFRYNYSDTTGCSLLIDIGARTTNLIFIEPKKVFSRSIPIGGTTITIAVAKDFEEPFGAAEERKKAVGFVSLGGAYAEPADPEVARVSKVVRNTMTRLHAEISRSISFYRSQQQGSPPERVFLCGGTASLPYMREFFQEKLQLPIDYFNPLRNVSVGGGLDLAEVGKNAHVLGELVGLSLRAVSDCPMELNLQPASVLRKKELRAKRPYLVVAGLCVLLCLAGWYVYFLRAAQIESQVLQAINPKVASLTALQNQFDAVHRQLTESQELAEPLLAAVDDRTYWVRILDELNTRLPPRYIWVTELHPIQPGADFKSSAAAAQTGAASSTDALAGLPPVPPPESESHGPPGFGGGPPGLGGARASDRIQGLVIRGLYLRNDELGAGVIDQFIKNLSQSPYFDIDLSKMNEINPVRAAASDTEWASEYELHLNLKKGIRIR